MSGWRLALCATLLACSAALGGEGALPPKQLFTWEELPPIPSRLGVGGPFVGVSGGDLIVTGGANFPTPLFEGGKKQWVDTVFSLDPRRMSREDGEWGAMARLRQPLAYGASVTWKDNLVCIGGCDAERCCTLVFRWVRQFEPDFPPLPKPCAMMGAALIGDTIYVAGGQETPTATEGMRNFWALDLSKPGAKWQELEPWPGPGRVLPVVAAQSDGYETQVYVISGAELFAGPDAKPARRYLTDGYAYSPKAKTWRRIADAPRPVVAAPAIASGQAHILVFGGDDGANANRVQELKDSHPGFSRDVLGYHTITNTWAKLGEMPLGQVTTVAVRWQGGIVIPSGEIRPGARTPKVFIARPVERETHFQALDYMVLAAYLLALVAIGFYIAPREKSTDDFFLAGRRVPWWAAGLSIFGTQLSAITFLSIPAAVFATDWVPFLANLCIVLVAPVVVYFYLPFFRRLNVTTAYEYLEKRFNLAVRLFGSVSFILYQLGRMGIVVLLPALALSAVSGLDVTASILIMGVLATFYTVLGGIEAVIWTDVLQVFVLMGGAVLCLGVMAAGTEGGLGGLAAQGAADGKFRLVNWTWDCTAMSLWVVVLGNFLTVLVPYTTDQAVVQRYLTTRDERSAARSIWTNAFLSVPASLLFFGIGTALYVFYKSRPALLDPAQENNAVFASFIARELPVGVSGLVIAGVFAAAMSTLDSSMNSIATALVTDFYRRLRPAADDRRCLRLARWLTGILGALGTGAALLLAALNIRYLWFFFTSMLGLLGGALAGVFALGIFTRRANGAGALIGGAAGIAASAFACYGTPIHFYLYGAIGVAVAFAVGYAASFAFPRAARPLDGLTAFTMRKAADPALYPPGRS
ncbi:MAG TPA: sodium/solute symporter [Planctomycetota bacterium]|nr:sodium/solute symporter [Planctomycetota bacterium]HRR82860.1 sodium/solute symporter [Planctomycetota bacterium]HRT96409.1 sodium/solute symporter [Planctomycetota bacterium]